MADTQRAKEFVEAEKAEDSRTNIEVANLSEKVKKSFLEYAMSVIVARAIPDVKDGMKPVHRRILYGMSEAGIYSTTPHKKSARIVGDVMGKYHPHGDSSIYEAMVRLAQRFNTRYPLVDGHGNFGSIDGDGAAAMRYTEARMSKIAMEMVRDIHKDTVDLVPNYDGEDEEPVALPSRFPNVIVNGATGIAVGMATNIPPHNLREAIEATLAIYENPDITVAEVMDIMPGPDFPTGAYILGRGGIVKAYETGQGTIIIRSKCEIEAKEGAKPRIIIHEVPYGVNKATMSDRMRELARDKVIDGITDIRDESAGEDVRVVIELRKDVVPEVILNQLYKNTSLQVSYGINNLVLVNGEPKVLGIIDLLKYYMNHQFDVVTRRIKFDLAKDEERNHILEGMIIALNNIDEIVETIRSAKDNDDSANQLMERFGLSEKQAKAILAMTLSKLNSLESQKIIQEHEEILAEINEFKRILADKNEIYLVIKREMLEIADKYSDKRRTQILNVESNIDDEDLIPQEDIIVTLSEKGYIKRVPVDTYRAQKRGGKGLRGMSTNEDDIVEKIVAANTHEDVLFFTNLGRVYRMRGHQIPEYSRTSKGIPAVNLLKLLPEEKIKSIISIDNKSHHITDENTLFFVTRNGIIKRVSLVEFIRINSNGKKAIGLRDDDEFVAAVTCNECLEGIIAACQLERISSSLERHVTFNVTVLVIDLLELVEVDHEDITCRSVSILLGRFTCYIFFELRPVVKARKLVYRYLVVQRNDIDIKHHYRRTEAEERRRKPQGLKHARNRYDDRIDGACQILFSDSKILFSKRS